MDGHGSLAGRSALIVGGTGGVGRRMALSLARAHAAIVVHGGHDRQKGEQVVQQIDREGGTARLMMLELRSMSDSVPLAESAAEVDVLVCAFGPFLRAPLEQTGASQWQRVVDLNLVLPGVLVSSALPAMIEHGFGRIILFGGTGTDTTRGYTTVAAYSAAKIGLGVIAKSIARSYAKKNVTCNVLTLGYVDTEYVSERDRTAWSARSRTGALQSADEIADFAAQIVCSKSGIPNGAVIDLSAGMI